MKEIEKLRVKFICRLYPEYPEVVEYIDGINIIERWTNCKVPSRTEYAKEEAYYRTTIEFPKAKTKDIMEQIIGNLEYRLPVLGRMDDAQAEDYVPMAFDFAKQFAFQVGLSKNKWYMKFLKSVWMGKFKDYETGEIYMPWTDNHTSQLPHGYTFEEL